MVKSLQQGGAFVLYFNNICLGRLYQRWHLKMTDQVFMSPKNGSLAVGIPLYTHAELWLEETSVKFSVFCGEPAAYMIDYGGEAHHLMSAEWVEKHLECLGGL